MSHPVSVSRNGRRLFPGIQNHLPQICADRCGQRELDGHQSGIEQYEETMAGVLIALVPMFQIDNSVLIILMNAFKPGTR